MRSAVDQFDILAILTDGAEADTERRLFLAHTALLSPAEQLEEQCRIIACLAEKARQTRLHLRSLEEAPGLLNIVDPDGNIRAQVNTLANLAITVSDVINERGGIFGYIANMIQSIPEGS